MVLNLASIYVHQSQGKSFAILVAGVLPLSIPMSALQPGAIPILIPVDYDQGTLQSPESGGLYGSSASRINQQQPWRVNYRAQFIANL